MIRLKPYLSWSQFDLWSKSKVSYYKRYCLGEASKPNKYFNKGKEVGEYLEQLNNSELDAQSLAQTLSTDPLLWQVGQLVPRLDFMEDKLEFEIEGEKMLAFTDTANVENTLYLEYKTGKEEWTQDRVDLHDQLLFYALGYWIKSSRKTIPDCKLVWIETEERDINDELGNFSHTQIFYTGRVETFERSFVVAELVDFEKRVVKTLIEINDWEYLELEVSEDKVDRYIYLQQLIEEAETEMRTIKTELMVEMQMDQIDYASSSKGRFSMVKKKSWLYSEDLQNQIKEVNSHIKKRKKDEEKDGTASSSINEYLTFRKI